VEERVILDGRLEETAIRAPYKDVSRGRRAFHPVSIKLGEHSTHATKAHVGSQGKGNSQTYYIEQVRSGVCTCAETRTARQLQILVAMFMEAGG
jgi:hypothetical protein